MPTSLALQEALKQISRGEHPIAIPLGQKRPIGEDWPKRALDINAGNAAQFFARECNVGLLLFPHTADVDIDASEAVSLINRFPALLPPTAAEYGRRSKTRSHRLYHVAGTKMLQLHDLAGSMLVELRHGPGVQSLIPPSLHIEDDGRQEYSDWVSDGIPTDAGAGELEAAVRRLAAAAFLVRHYPANGSRHEFALALAGALLNVGWSAQDIAGFLQPVAVLAADEELRNRLQALQSTERAHANGKGHTGWPTLIKILGQQVVEHFAGLLAIARPEALEGPRPLHRAIPLAVVFPVSALGAPLEEVVRAIGRLTGAPLSIVANSVLAACTLVAQALIDVVLPTGDVRPVSLYFIVIAESGERKSVIDGRTTQGIREFETLLEGSFRSAFADWQKEHLLWAKIRDQILNDRRAYPDIVAKRAVLDALGPEPPPPLRPEILVAEPTIEGLIRVIKNGRASAGVFSDEGGGFLTGYSMQPERRITTAAHLCSLWDGKDLRRPRQGEGVDILRGCRLSLHLMIQPLIADYIFGDAELRNQGLISRILATYPESTIGTRAWHQPTTEETSAIENFATLLRTILALPLTVAAGTTNQLMPHRLALTPAAQELWVKFVELNEVAMRRGGEYENIRGLANKLAEIAVRIAGVLTLIRHVAEGKSLPLPDLIEARTLADAIVIAQFYAGEALRIAGEAGIDRSLRLAVLTLKWLQETWSEPGRLISLPDLYRLGPAAIRDKATASEVVKLLIDHGWLVEARPQIVNGKPRRQVWRIIDGPEE
ncbi:MAG: DUF3987 domain-containing protein [Deltaproteobacteria bacterium]|nr:DUF3987 domain-containing protein [Deltaproteobacteria bacterium]